MAFGCFDWARGLGEVDEDVVRLHVTLRGLSSLKVCKECGSSRIGWSCIVWTLDELRHGSDDCTAVLSRLLYKSD